MPSQKLEEDTFKEASEKLLAVFGFKVVEIPEKKQFIVINVGLPDIPREAPTALDAKLLVILSSILMSGNKLGSGLYPFSL